MDPLTALLVSIALQIVVYAITPKPKRSSTSSVQDIDTPTASSGMLIPEVIGCVTVKTGNVLWYGDKSTHEYSIKV